MKHVFKKQSVDAAIVNVAWPAAAGNVFWSISVLISEYYFPDPDAVNDSRGLRLLILVLLMVYMALNWLRLRPEPKVAGEALVYPASRGWIYWIWDFVHLSALCVFAITVSQVSDPATSRILAFIFLLTGFGHFFGVWADDRNNAGWRERITLGCVNFLGFAVLWLVSEFATASYTTALASALAVALIAWTLSRLWLDRGEPTQQPIA